MFHPSTDVLAFSETLLGLSPFTTPVIWLTGNPQLAYNLAFLLSFPFSAFGTYALVYALTRRHDAAILGGLIFGFNTYRFSQMPHIQCLVTGWMPLALLGLHKYTNGGGRWWLALFGVAWALQGLTNGYYLLFFSVLVLLWLLWFVDLRTWRTQLATIGAAWSVAALPLVPILLEYKAVHEHLGLQRGLGEILAFSPDATALASTMGLVTFWSQRLLRPGPEGELFPGITGLAILLLTAIVASPRLPRWRPGGMSRVRAVLLGVAVLTTLVALSIVIIGPWELNVFGASISATRLYKPLGLAVSLWLLFAFTSPSFIRARQQRAPIVFYASATVLMWALAFGPHINFFGVRLMSGPYSWLLPLPGFSNLRVPARFAMIAILCLGIVAGLAFARMAGRLGRLRPLVFALALCGVTLDAWLDYMPIVASPGPVAVLEATSGEGALLELPTSPDNDLQAMHRAMRHGRPIVNGYSGYAPPYFDLVVTGLQNGDKDVLAVLADRGLRFVSINRPADAEGRFEDLLAHHPHARFVAQRADHVLFELKPRESRHQRASGTVIPMKAVSSPTRKVDVEALTDNQPVTAWRSGAPQRGDEELMVDLGSTTRVCGVDMAVGIYRGDYPRNLLIEGSIDGAEWTPMWKNVALSLLVEGLLDDPRVGPMRVEVTPSDVRFVRIRQLGWSLDVWWSVSELSINGC